VFKNKKEEHEGSNEGDKGVLRGGREDLPGLSQKVTRA
jgi:hypothetical protein